MWKSNSSGNKAAKPTLNCPRHLCGKVAAFWNKFSRFENTSQNNSLVVATIGSTVTLPCRVFMKQVLLSLPSPYFHFHPPSGFSKGFTFISYLFALSLSPSQWGFKRFYFDYHLFFCTFILPAGFHESGAIFCWTTHKCFLWAIISGFNGLKSNFYCCGPAVHVNNYKLKRNYTWRTYLSK